MENSFIKNKNIVGQITAIFFTQASSAAAYAVFFSGLSLYLTQKELFTKEAATAITGLFLSLNYFLQLIGGIIANRVITYKKLYCLGSTVSVAGCLLLAYAINLKLGLALFLMSSLVSNVCLNMFITKLFRDDQVNERRIAFIWNYVGMNLGFLVGGFLSGYYTILNSYSHLFMIMSVFIVVSMILTIAFIKINEADSSVKKSTIYQFGVTSLIMAGIVIFIVALFCYSNLSQNYMTVLSLALLGGLIHYGFKKSGTVQKKVFFQYAFYSGVDIVFWTIYMLTPMAFMQIIQNDVQHTIFGITLAPQWFMNIDSIVILALAPQLAFLLRRQNSGGKKPLGTLGYFTLAFLFVTSAFLLLLLCLSVFIDHAMLPIWGILGYMILLTVGEIFISPIGNSLIGELIPESMRALMTGAWSMNIGIGGLLASVIANRFILPYVDKNGLVGSNLVQFQNIILILSTVLILLTTGLYLYRKSTKSEHGIFGTT